MVVEQNDFKHIIAQTFRKINSIPGGNAKFFERFSGSRTLVSNWKRGIINPSLDDELHFAEVATSILKENEEKNKGAQRKRNAKIDELSSLISA